MSYLRIGIAYLSLLAAGCGDDGKSTMPAQSEDAGAVSALSVESLELAPDIFEDVIEVTGTVEAINDATLSAQSTGTLETLAPLGKTVARNEIIARLNQDLVLAAVYQGEAQVATSQAAAELAQDIYDRQVPLYQDSIISAVEFDQSTTRLRQAEATLKASKAGLAQARKQLANTEVRAPFTGRIEQHFVHVWEQLAPGVSVIRIVNARRVRVVLGIPERYASDIEVGTIVEFTARDSRAAPKTGTVTFVGSTIDPRNRTFTVEAEIPNADGSLKPEMIVEARVIRDRINNVLVVPRIAIVRDEVGSSIFVVHRDGRGTHVSRQRVEPGPMFAGRAVIAEGLKVGDEIVVSGQNTLTENARVSVEVQYSHLDAEGTPQQ